MFSKMLSIAIALAVITTAIVLAGVATAQEYVTDGLIGFWTMDENTIDGKTVRDVWEDNDGEMVGNPKIVAGKIDEALDFDGDDHVQLPDMGEHETVTIELWWNASNFNWFSAFVAAPTSDPGMVHFKILNGIQVLVNKTDGGKVLTAEKTWDDWKEQWFHTAYTCDTVNNELKLYVDGELIGTDSSGATPVNLTGNMIGQEKGDRWFIGAIDEVRIYDRVLSEDEMKQNYNVKSNSRAVNLSGKLTATWGKVKTRY